LCDIKLAAKESNGRPRHGEPRETPCRPFYDHTMCSYLTGAGAQAAPSRPRLPPLRSLEKMGAGESRRVSRAVRSSLAAFNIAGRSTEKTAAKVVCWQRRVCRGKLQRCKGNRASRSCFVGTPAAVPGRITLRAFGCRRTIQRRGRSNVAAWRQFERALGDTRARRNVRVADAPRHAAPRARGFDNGKFFGARVAEAKASRCRG
jgi:hypothetical protein